MGADSSPTPETTRATQMGKISGYVKGLRVVDESALSRFYIITAEKDAATATT